MWNCASGRLPGWPCTPRYEKNRLFVDEQLQGPFASWIHRHEFEDLGVATRLTDRVECRLPGGDVVNSLCGWMVTLGLTRCFATVTT